MTIRRRPFSVKGGVFGKAFHLGLQTFVLEIASFGQYHGSFGGFAPSPAVESSSELFIEENTSLCRLQ